MKKESERKGFSPEESKGSTPSLHDLYFTEDIDIEEELYLMEADPRLKDVTGEPGTLDKIKTEWARRNTDVEISEEIAGITGSDVRKSGAGNKGVTAHQITDVVTEVELSHLSPEARELIELGMKAKAGEDDDEPKARVIRKRSKRIFFAVAAILVMSMAAGTTGVTSLYKYLQVEEKGDGEQFRFVDSENDMVISDTTIPETEAYAEINKFFGTTVVKLHGDLAGLEFQEVLYHEEDMSADVVYYWEGKSIFYSVQTNYNQLSLMSGTGDEMVDKWDEIIGDIRFSIEKLRVEGTDGYSYTIIFEYNSLFYSIRALRVNGNFEEILNYLHI